MACPHGGKPIRRLGGTSASIKRRLQTAAVIAAVSAVILSAVWVFRPMPSKASLVGTWCMTVPVGDVLSSLSENMTDGVVSDMLSLFDKEQAVTVYCRFFEDDTYAVYADADQAVTAAQTAVRSAVTYACEEGVPALIEKGELPDTAAWLLRGASNMSSDTLTSALDKVMAPFYETIRRAMVPPTQTGNRRYRLSRDRVFTALQAETALDESVYLVWQWDGDALRMSAGSLFGCREEEFVWKKCDVSSGSSLRQ